eukprot:4873977-Prymnesium_polylepis.1
MARRPCASGFDGGCGRCAVGGGRGEARRDCGRRRRVPCVPPARGAAALFSRAPWMAGHPVTMGRALAGCASTCLTERPFGRCQRDMNMRHEHVRGVRAHGCVRTRGVHRLQGVEGLAAAEARAPRACTMELATIWLCAVWREVDAPLCAVAMR